MWMASKIFLEKSLGSRASILTLSESKWCLAVFTNVDIQKPLRWRKMIWWWYVPWCICPEAWLIPRYNTCDSHRTPNNKQFQPIDQEEVCLWVLQGAYLLTVSTPLPVGNDVIVSWQFPEINHYISSSWWRQMVIWRKIYYNWRLVNNFVMQKFHLIIVLEKYGLSFDIKKCTTSGWALGDENVISIRSFSISDATQLASFLYLTTIIESKSIIGIQSKCIMGYAQNIYRQFAHIP